MSKTDGKTFLKKFLVGLLSKFRGKSKISEYEVIYDKQDFSQPFWANLTKKTICPILKRKYTFWGKLVRKINIFFYSMMCDVRKNETGVKNDLK